MFKKILFSLSIGILSFVFTATGYAGWLDVVKSMIPASATQTKLSDTQIGQGLREALSLGIDRAVASAGREGGFLDNDAIKIKFPEKLAMVETGMRKIGMGSKIDEFETGVNRAAEKAAPEAKEILLDALVGMSIQDAQKLLKGGDTAATDYFRKTSWDRLYTAFQPYMHKTMDQYAASQSYNQIIAAYQKIPFAKKPVMVSADEYATNKALEGLFFLVAEQEKKIRTDPAARVTDILKSVFG